MSNISEALAVLLNHGVHQEEMGVASDSGVFNIIFAAHELVDSGSCDAIIR